MTDSGCSMHVMHVMQSAGMTWVKHAALQSFEHVFAAVSLNAARYNVLEGNALTCGCSVAALLPHNLLFFCSRVRPVPVGCPCMRITA